MEGTTPVSRRKVKRRSVHSNATSTPKSPEDPSDTYFLSQAPSEDGVYWAYDNPRLDEELRRKMKALDEASPTILRRKPKSTPKPRLRLVGNSKRNNNNPDDAKQFIQDLNDCFKDIGKTLKSGDNNSEESTDLFDDDEDDEKFLLMASQAIETPRKRPSISKRASDPFEDDSFDVILSQIPENAFNKSSPKLTRLSSFKRYGSSNDAFTVSMSSSHSSSFRRSNSSPVVEKEKCSEEEIKKKKEEALKKKQMKSSLTIGPQKRQEIELKRREALRRRNISQSNCSGK